MQGYGKTAHSVVLDYAVNVLQLKPEDQMLGYGELGNFSVAGFEMVLNRWRGRFEATTKSVCKFPDTSPTT